MTAFNRYRNGTLRYFEVMEAHMGTERMNIEIMLIPFTWGRTYVVLLRGDPWRILDKHIAPRPYLHLIFYDEHNVVLLQV